MTSVVVIGGGAAGLVAARSAVLAGAEVTLLEATDRLGGAVASEEVGGVRLDTGAESIAARGRTALDLFAALGLEPVSPAASGAWLQTSGGPFPLPAAGILGIPGSPLADDVRAVLGGRAALRAWLDSVLPVLTIGRETNLGRLVRRRMGSAVLDTLVTPVVRNVYAVDPGEADVEALAPGLNGALTRSGSLSSAVLQLRASAPAGSAVRGLDGGMATLVDALERDLDRFGVRVLRSTPATALTREPGGWRVETPSGPQVADRVILAGSGASARRLLAPLLPGLLEDWPAAHRTTVVTLVVDAPVLDEAPRGSGVLVADGVPGVRAGALTHASAKWPWLAARLPAGRHVLRLSYRGDAAEGTGAEEALADAARLLGREPWELTVVGSAVTPWTQESQRALIGMRSRIEDVRAAVAEIPGLEVAGAWVAGTGLASVLADGDRAGRAV
ncbi:NAD(P)/FAD-dependent oxidoreductase [Naasia sp. SYSU D00948]|uniref:protoporphyrinogen/coproporphyrinogen oxidase n=1 Tax=Naasia sp. SYSU D00948 TaxID=2817379 RepID=UPI001B307717|nr:FAD-dependent oxidoreductase [Naasia sp. SYSU D00948]